MTEQDKKPTSLDEKRKQEEEKQKKNEVAKSKATKKQKIENNYSKGEEEQLDTITEEEINKIKSDACYLRMPDLSKILPEDHFINVYAKYGLNSTDSFYEYHVMNGFWLLSTYAKRHVYFHSEKGKLRPNIWATNIGHSTISGRSTAYDKASEIYEKIQGDEPVDENFSLEGYYCAIRESTGESGIAWLDLGRDEAGSFYATVNKSYNEGFYADECKIYDGKGAGKRLNNDKDGNERLNSTGKTCTTQLFNMTPEDLTDYLTLKIIRKGYGFRRLYTFPKYEKEIKGLRPHSEQDDTDLKNVCDCFKNIRKRFTIKIRSHDEPEEPSKDISFVIEPEALDYYNKIDKEMKEKYGGYNKNETMLGVWGRYSIYALKLAMLIEVGKSEFSNTISLETMKISLQLINEYFLPTFKVIIEYMEEDQTKNNVTIVLSKLKARNGLCQRDILLRESNLTERPFDEVIQTLIRSNTINAMIDDKYRVVYTYKTDDDRKFEEENLENDKENILSKLKNKGNNEVWNELKRSLHLDKSRFDNAINSLLFERKIEVKKDSTKTDKPRKIISLIN